MERAREVIARETVEIAAPAAPAPVSSRGISLNDRQEEFWQAAMRGIDQDFVVFEDWEMLFSEKIKVKRILQAAMSCEKLEVK
jgi:hypothetical protein